MYRQREESESENSIKQLNSTAGIQRENKNPEFQKEIQLKEKAHNNTGLPDSLKAGVENLSGHSMDDVKVHYNSAKPAQLNAHAYAQGNQIHLASGQEKHLPHEAWHVVQQKQGRVQPTINVNGAKVNDDTSLEKEADVMGGKALQFKREDTRSDGYVIKRVSLNSILQQKSKVIRFNDKSTIQFVKESQDAMPVPQGGFLIHESITGEDAIKTIGIGPCVALAINVKGKEIPLIALAHFDSTTEPRGSVNKILNYFKDIQKEDYNPSNLIATVLAGTEDGRELLEAMVEDLISQGVEIALSKVIGKPVNLKVSAEQVESGKPKVSGFNVNKEISPADRALAEIRQDIKPLVPTKSKDELIEEGLLLCDKLLRELSDYEEWYNTLSPSDQTYAEENFQIVTAKINLAFHYSQKLETDPDYLKQIVLNLIDSMGSMKSIS